MKGCLVMCVRLLYGWILFGWWCRIISIGFGMFGVIVFGLYCICLIGRGGWFIVIMVRVIMYVLKVRFSVCWLVFELCYYGCVVWF